jgi:UDP-glucuronate 4-epimerase
LEGFSKGSRKSPGHPTSIIGLRPHCLRKINAGNRAATCALLNSRCYLESVGARVAHPIIVTGAAGFIGHAVSRRLLAEGEKVIGIDNLNDYYDPKLKRARLETLLSLSDFRFERMDIAEPQALRDLVQHHSVKRIVHLAAQAGVRHSIDNPFAYEHSNLAGHLSILEACRSVPEFEHLVYASSSSVYGERPLNSRGFHEDDPCHRPVSLYAATKRSCELMSTAYARLFGMPQTGLRFFTVYGPWGRPDMAYYKFAEKMLAGEPIEIFGNGAMARDFTYIDDIVEGVLGALQHPPRNGEHRILNIGDSRPVSLLSMVDALESALGVEAIKIMRPMQPGDVRVTFASIARIHDLTGYRPKVPLETGLRYFADWFSEYRSRSRLAPNVAEQPQQFKRALHERVEIYQ